MNGANVGNAVLKFDLEGNYLGKVGFPSPFSRQKLASEKVHYSFFLFKSLISVFLVSRMVQLPCGHCGGGCRAGSGSTRGTSDHNFHYCYQGGEISEPPPKIGSKWVIWIVVLICGSGSADSHRCYGRWRKTQAPAFSLGLSAKLIEHNKQKLFFQIWNGHVQQFRRFLPWFPRGIFIFLPCTVLSFR